VNCPGDIAPRKSERAIMNQTASGGLVRNGDRYRQGPKAGESGG
jgi:hypothetical protein